MIDHGAEAKAGTACHRRRAVSGNRTGGAARWLVAGVGLSTAWMASVASSHTAPVTIPPDSDYVIRWFQPHSVQPVEDWEIEVTPRSNTALRFVATAQVMPDDSCWALNVPVAEPASVRVRSVSGSQVSAWSRTTTVPEPGLATGIGAATGLLGLLVRRRARAASDQSS
jgi:hypothetical protein